MTEPYPNWRKGIRKGIKWGLILSVLFALPNVFIPLEHPAPFSSPADVWRHEITQAYFWLNILSLFGMFFVVSFVVASLIAAFRPEHVTLGVHARKRIRVVIAALVAANISVAAGLYVSTFVPIVECHQYYCFFCGRLFTNLKIWKVPVWLSSDRVGIYHDGIVIPPHSHRWIEINGFQHWLFHETEHWDEFGWTGAIIREAMAMAVKRMPDKEREIVTDYFQVEPWDKESRAVFLKKYRHQPPQ
jgi:hypothetical protein